MIKDSKGYIWVGTDNGIARYDGKQFIHATPTVNLNLSFTHLQENSEGIIWGLGFPANVIYIQNDSIFRLGDFSKKNTNLLKIALDQQDILSIFCDTIIYRYNTLTRQYIDTTIEDHNNMHYYADHYNARMNAHKPELTQYSLDQLKYISPPYNIVDRLVIKYGIPRTTLKSRGFFIQLKQELFFAHEHNVLTSIVFFNIRNDSAIIVPPEQLPFDIKRIIGHLYLNDSTIIVGSEQGLYGFNHQFKSIIAPPLFPQYTISSIVQDHEDNIWLSTTQKGLLIIPSLKIQYFTPSNSNIADNDLAQLATDGQYLYIGSKKGIIQRLDSSNNITYVTQSPPSSHFLRLMDYHAPINSLLFSDLFTFRYDLASQQTVRERSLIGPAPNKISVLPNKDWIISSYNTAYGQHRDNAPPNFLPASKFLHRTPGKKGMLVKNIEIRLKRSTSHIYNPITNIYWFGYSNDVRFLRDSIENIFKINGADITAFDMEYTNNGMTWIASNNGLYKIDTNGLYELMTTNDGLYKNTITRIVKQDSFLCLIFRGGLQLYNYKNTTFKTFTEADGLPSPEINDVEFFNNKIYIATAKGLIALPYDYTAINTSAPLLKITEVFINDSLQSLQSSYVLPHSDNNIEVHFDLIAYKAPKEVRLKSRLKGNNDNWDIDINPSQKLRFRNLRPNTYTLELIAINEDGYESAPKQITFTILPPFYQTWWFWGLMGGLFFLILWLSYKIRIQNLKKEAAIQQRLIQSEIKAIKSQMNPHFIFNALNSIQDLILKKDIRTSNKYLVKFSLLIRKVLELSSKDLVSLEEEWDLLLLYVELEKLRFDDLEFSLNNALGEYMLDELQLPPLIIQPYVENSFKHGLLHKQGARKINIDFKVLNNELICIIEDNGIGREKSNEINARQQRHQHKSFATAANQQRIDLINATLDTASIHVNIIDLPDHSGTKVELTFPILIR